MRTSKLPYKSDAQRKKFHAMLGRGDIAKAVVAEYDRASKGKQLPSHVKKAPARTDVIAPARMG